MHVKISRCYLVLITTMIFVLCGSKGLLWIEFVMFRGVLFSTEREFRT